MAKPKSREPLDPVGCVHIVILLGSEGDGVDSSRLLRLRIAGYIARAVGSGAGREV